ncbi:F-box protein At3g07870-like [Papaver somniferum]|uniref:F-box protein At3g07870-like n=1 Tax=Papaver somniferum TaxID=3469 RepID=UPI000E7040F5|nr:F-box protein At3g07870-like [Papaver somniferum]
MEDGVFKEISQPEEIKDFSYRFVDVLRGYLCLLCSVSDTKFEIWEMKDYGVRESWSKVFKIDQQQLTTTMGIRLCKYIRRVVSLKDGEILLEMIVKDGRHGWYCESVNVVKIHLDETKRSQNRRGYEYMKNIFQMEAYTESLVSVNSGTFVWKEQKATGLKNFQIS